MKCRKTKLGPEFLQILFILNDFILEFISLTFRSVLVLIIPTYTEGTPPDTAKWFYNWLEESSTDFRVGAHFLKGLKFAVFGLGNSEYKDHFNTVGKNCDKFLFQLSAERISPLCLGKTLKNKPIFHMKPKPREIFWLPLDQ